MDIDFPDEPWFEGRKIFRTLLPQLEYGHDHPGWIWLPESGGPFFHNETA